jgi:hypothetical protein
MIVENFKVGSDIYTAADIENLGERGFDSGCWVGQKIQVNGLVETIKSFRAVSRDKYFKVYIETDTQQIELKSS